MGVGVPLVHCGQRFVALVHDQHRRFGDHVQLTVGDHHRDFDDAVGVWFQPGHFHVQPDEMLGILRHNARL
ncbi:hypothetical protein D3C72_1971740 [compost metagenome]